MKHNAFIICTGVGHINRGYESFTTECFNELENSPQFELYLLKGGGVSIGKEIRINCVQRHTSSAKLLAKITGKENYWIEQFTFLMGMLPQLIKYKPEVIYYSDFILGTFLWHLRRFLNFKYKLLFSNGAPNGPPYKTEDHVQQLLPVYLESAIAKGAPSEMQTLLPYGFKIDVNERINNLVERQTLRQQLGLSNDKKIILSVGAVNKHHKRMDYIINEIAQLPNDYFLIILGQFEQETPELLKLANDKLPNRHLIASVPYEKVKDYYLAADYFVLASLIEGFGRVIIEAMSYGLPCIVNDYVNARQVLGNYGYYIDMKKEGELASLMIKNSIKFNNEVLIEYAYNTYSWDKLKNKYSNMIAKLID